MSAKKVKFHTFYFKPS